MAKAKPVTKREEMAARAIVQRAMNQERERDHAEKLKLVGRCFKNRNRYSDGETWWLYAIVTSVEDGRVLCTQFQHTSMDAIEIQVSTYGGMLPNGGWSEITADEFRAAAVLMTTACMQRLGAATALAAVDPVAANSR